MRTFIILAAVLLLAGCSTLDAVDDGFYRWEHNSATPASHGSHQLVKMWLGKPYDPKDDWAFSARPHFCQYDNGVILEQYSRELCPRTL